MSKSILISIRPKWCELIANGKKTIEVRKTKPKLETPFKVYIYCTKASKAHQTICGCMILNNDELYRHPTEGIKYGDSIELMLCDNYSQDNFLNGKVIGEFVCNGIITDKTFGHDAMFNIAACLNDSEIAAYFTKNKMYGFHISDLVIYDKPKELSEFKKPCDVEYDCFLCRHFDKDNLVCSNIVPRPPQSWYYVEEL